MNTELYTIATIIITFLLFSYPEPIFSMGAEENVAPALLDLSIADIKPAQVVFDADINNDSRIDLVKGKNTKKN